MSELTPEETRPCPFCGRPISPTIAICPRCEKSVAEGSTWPPRPAGYSPYLPPAAKPLLGGLAASNIAASLLVLLNFAVGYFLGSRGVTLDGALLAIDPILLCLTMGIVSAWFWRRLTFTPWQRFGYSALNGLAGMAVAAVFLREGIICLAMISPLVFVVIWAGNVMGNAIVQRGNSRLQSSLAPLLILLVLGDGRRIHNHADCVTDTLVIRARPAQVWNYVAGFPTIPENAPSDYWLFTIGLPRPVQSVAVGSRRQCIFSGNAVFEERITERIPAHRLTFAVVGQPTRPEVLTHLELERGQFTLRDNGDGTTTLVGSSWYRLRIHPVWYYNPWAHDVVRHVHLRVMRHIQSLAEKEAGHRP